MQSFKLWIIAALFVPGTVFAVEEAPVQATQDLEQSQPTTLHMRTETKKLKKTSSKINSVAEEKEVSRLAPGVTFDAPATILPEVTTTVKMSASDLNRIICPVEIKDVLASDEKGVLIKITGKDAFIKFKVNESGDGKLTYSTTPTEIYVICGSNTFSMIALPGRVPAQTIKLSTGRENRITENTTLYSGLPFEKKILRAIKDVFTDNIPDSYRVVRPDQIDTSYKGLVIALRRDVDIEGEGIRVKEFHVNLKQGQPPFILSEKQFLRKDIATNPVAVAIDKHSLKPGDTSRVFVVEQHAEKSFGSNLQLPIMDSETVASQPSTKNSPVNRPSTSPKLNPKMQPELQ